MLMNIKTLEWDKELFDQLGIPFQKGIQFPEIKKSAEIYGYLNLDGVKIPISGCIGDQQAATVGQLCFQPGETKTTFGTGEFVVMNTGKNIVQSKHGLLTTICYQFDDNQPIYALEGSIAVAGSGVDWLKNNVGLIEDSNEIEYIAKSVNDTGGVYFVPAFTGLFAPYWQANARATIVGLTLYTKKAHIARALLEGICYQTREILDAMSLDCGQELQKLKVDGGMSKNNLVMQLLADIIGKPVIKQKNHELTALGAAICSGLGIKKWKNVSEIPLSQSTFTTFTPQIDSKVREEKYSKWKLAIKTALTFQENN